MYLPLATNTLCLLEEFSLLQTGGLREGICFQGGLVSPERKPRPTMSLIHTLVEVLNMKTPSNVLTSNTYL